MKYKEDVENIISLWKERNDKEFAWVKQAISVISIILGLILTLKTGSPKNQTEYIIYIIAISINGLTILIGLLFLYSESDTVHSLICKYTDYLTIKKYTDGEQLIQVRPKKIYSILRILFFTFLISGILSLIFYAAYSNIPDKNTKIKTCANKT